MEDDKYTCEVIEDGDFSPDTHGGGFPLPAPVLIEEEEEELPEYLTQNISTEPKVEKVKEPKEIKGTVLKRKGGEWKDRYLHVRPQLRALFYYENLEKKQKISKPLGVYPLIGAHVSELKVEKDGSYTFTLTLRTTQKILFKVLDRPEARKWRSALRDTAQHPCIAPSEGIEKGECFLKQMLMKTKRTILLDYSSGYCYACKKNDEYTILEEHALKNSVLIPQKSFEGSYDMVVQTKKDYRKEYSFKNPEEWAKWCVKLEAAITQERKKNVN